MLWTGLAWHASHMERTTASPSGTTTPRDRRERRHADRLLDYELASIELRCSERMVRKLVETRQLESVKVGRLVRN